MIQKVPAATTMFLCMSAACGHVSGQAAGTFVPITNPVENLGNCSATVLHDGTVLVAGGTFDAMAEIFDPSTGTFTSAGTMRDARFCPTTTLLADGRVLIAGGTGAYDEANDNAGNLTSAEIYDPSKGTFQLTGSLPVEHYFGMAAALLQDGRVLVAGGNAILLDGKTLPLGVTAGGSADIYDPATGQFAPAGVIPMVFPTATPLADGRVLLVGTTIDGADNIAFTYDPISGTFDPTGSQAPHSIFPNQANGATTMSFCAVALANGDVLLSGGYDIVGQESEYAGPLGARSTAEIYDPSTGNFRATGTLPGEFFRPSAATLPGGRVFVGGTNNAALYDPASGTFTGSLSPVGWFGENATALPDGTVLVTGNTPNVTGQNWVYTPTPTVVSSASLAITLAPESLASIFGGRLAGTTVDAADSESLSTSLGGVSVHVLDGTGAERPATLLYVSPSQINFEVPAGTVPGSVTVSVLNGSATIVATAQVNAIAPGIFTVPGNIAAAYGTRIESDGSQTILPPASPIMLDQRPVYLSLFGTGIRGRSSLNNVTATIGGLNALVTYAGPQGSIPGLDQVNVLVSASLQGVGLVPLVVTADGVATNQVLVGLK